MSAIFIISVLLLFVASFALLRTKRPHSNQSSDLLPPGINPRGLFDDSSPDQFEHGRYSAKSARNKSGEEFEKILLERATLGDLEALRDAHTQKNAQLYSRVLDVLVERASVNTSELHSLVAFIARDTELRSSPKLAELLKEEWERNPTSALTAELLRVAALSDDALTFEGTLEAVLCAMEGARLDGLSASELRSLIEAEYWLLSSEAKRSGAGFRLKQKLADARQRLSQHARRETPPNAGEFSDEFSAEKERQ